MLFSSLQEPSVHTMWSPREAGLDRRADRRHARRIKALAAGLERVSADARHASAWTAPSRVSLIHPSVAIACETSLRELAARLRAGLVDPTSAEQIDRFLTDGTRSPLYGTNVAAARIEALRLLDLSAR